MSQKIALAVASTIDNLEINFILLAGCSDDLNKKYSTEPSNEVHRILSIYDSEDGKCEFCEGIIQPSSKSSFGEIDLDSAKGHNAFRITKDTFI